MNKLKIPIIIFAVILGLILIKVFFLSPKKQDMAGSFLPGAPKPSTMVTAYVVKPEVLDNEVYSSGTVSANEEVELRPEVPGKIVVLNIVEGGRVSKGELLVKINDADLQAQLKKMNLQLTLAEEKEGRQKKLLDISGISKEEYEIALNQVNVIKSDIENMSAQIAKTEIRAPFNGVLGLKKVSAGSYITPSTLVATMQQIDPIKVDFSVPEKYMDKIKNGDKVFFSIQGLDGTFTANIYAIDPKIDLATRTVQLRAKASNSNGKIFPGAFATIQLVLKQNKGALMIPTESIIPILKGQKVYLYKNGKAQEKLVETGVRTPTRIEVIKGLQVGDTVVVTGVMSIRQDAPLKLIKAY
jgi:membrane fusion protein (multidrug efflux system)